MFDKSPFFFYTLLFNFIVSFLKKLNNGSFIKSLLKRILIGFEIFFVLLIIIAGVRSYILSPEVGFDNEARGTFLDLPTDIAFIPGDDNQFFVTEKITGLIKYFKEGEFQLVALDLGNSLYKKGWEEGLLGIAFDPQFKKRRHAYVFYTGNDSSQTMTITVSRFDVGEDMVFDKGSELPIITFDKDGESHNGGNLLFGADGYLYISIGYGAHITDTLQDRSTLLGTILRIDVSDSEPGKPYKIPADNPFVGKEGRGEIWAYGLRNPWRIGFDSQTKRLYAGDVGGTQREEINEILRGSNYGWPVMEGELKMKDGIDENDYEAPLASFPRSISRSVTGGVVYRGNDNPELVGKYVFADYLRGLYMINLPEKGELKTGIDKLLMFKQPTEYGNNIGEVRHIVSIKENSQRELFLVNLQGEILKVREISWGEQIEWLLFNTLNFK